MCTVLAWAGKLPKGFISRWLIQAEARGRDATGIAFRSSPTTSSISRRSIPASLFVHEHDDVLKSARKSPRGIAHTRHASRGNPINARNAHPFTYLHTVFAHNGYIHNYEEIRNSLIVSTKADLEASPTSDTLKKKLAYLEGCTTDSMVIGPFIDANDFSSLVGDMGLVWMRGSNVMCMRTKKELSVCTVNWWSEDSPDAHYSVTLAASTNAIIDNALAHTPGIDYVDEYYNVEEAHVYRLEDADLIDLGTVAVNPGNTHDDFSSGKIDQEYDAGS